MTPSLDQMTPEPQPRPPALMSTVERRRCSATSPKPVTVTSFPSVRTLADGDRGFLNGPAAYKFQRQLLANGLAMKLRMNVLQARDRLPAEGHENIADDDA